VRNLGSIETLLLREGKRHEVYQQSGEYPKITWKIPESAKTLRIFQFDASDNGRVIYGRVIYKNGRRKDAAG
jgi:hypothetical protein